MEKDEKRILADRLKPALVYLLEQASGGLETETKKLLEALGVYNLPYTELEELYLRDISRDKDPIFYRRLILQKHHNRVPGLRAKLMTLHLTSPNSIRSKIRLELPHIRWLFRVSPPILLVFSVFSYGISSTGVCSFGGQLWDTKHWETILVYNPGAKINNVTVTSWRFGGEMEWWRGKGNMESFTVKTWSAVEALEGYGEYRLRYTL